MRSLTKEHEVPDASQKPKTVPEVVDGEDQGKQRQQPPAGIARRYYRRSEVTCQIEGDQADPSPQGRKPPEGYERKYNQREQEPSRYEVTQGGGYLMLLDHPNLPIPVLAVLSEQTWQVSSRAVPTFDARRLPDFST